MFDFNDVCRTSQRMEAGDDPSASEPAKSVGHPVPVSERGWRWRHIWGLHLDVCDPLQGISNPLGFPLELRLVWNVLKRATTAFIEESTCWLHAISGLLQHFVDGGLSPALLHFAEPDTHAVAGRGPGDEHHLSFGKIRYARTAR